MDLKKQWLHHRVGSRNSNKGVFLRPPSIQIVFLSPSLSPELIPLLIPIILLSGYYFLYDAYVTTSCPSLLAVLCHYHLSNRN